MADSVLKLLLLGEDRSVSKALWLPSQSSR